MASSGATCDKYRIKKLSRLTKDTTEEEIKDLYKNWATTYEKVLHSRLFNRKTVKKKFKSHELTDNFSLDSAFPLLSLS